MNKDWEKEVEETEAALEKRRTAKSEKRVIQNIVMNNNNLRKEE